MKLLFGVLFLFLLLAGVCEAGRAEAKSGVWTSIPLRDAAYQHSHEPDTSAHLPSKPGKFYISLQNFKNTMYFGEISVGTPPQKLKVMFATGSADTWLPSTRCISEACQSHTRFDINASSTFHSTPNPFNITYTPGLLVGDTGTDTFHVGDCTLDNVPFGQIRLSARSFQAKYRWFPFDGIVGLSYAGASVSGQTPFFDQLLQHHLLQDQLFSLFLTQSPDTPGSTLLLGGTDPRFHLDEVTFFPVEPPYVFWMVNVSQITLTESALSAASALDRKTLVSLCKDGAGQKGCRAVVDSGTSMISGPSEAIEKLSAELKVDPACRNLEQLPVLAFQFYGTTFPLHPEDYVNQITVRGMKACFLALSAYDFPEQMGPMWVLGNTFLRKYYTVFDRRNNQIGFAMARPK